MTDIKNMTEATPELIQLMKEWEKKRKEAAKASEDEMALRKEIAALAFPSPKEGTNNLKLSGGFVLTVDHKISRTIDRAALEVYKDTFESASINYDELVRNKPELRVGEYKKLDDKQRAILDNVLTIKEGTPSVSITMKKRS